jgi:molybdenum cofactor guanylyltransferase
MAERLKFKGVSTKRVTNRVEDISCIVLAGGKSLRLGRDKALVNFDIGNLTERVLSRLSLFNKEIILVTSAVQNLDRFINYPGLRLVTDVYPERGPLGGLYTGLSVSMTGYNLVVACDMPFLNTGLLGYMAQLIPGFDAVVPRFGSYVEPLHAVYSRSCIAAVKKILDEETRPIKILFNHINVRYVESDEIDKFDPDHLSFFNINREADLEKARQLLKKEKESSL